MPLINHGKESHAIRLHGAAVEIAVMETAADSSETAATVAEIAAMVEMVVVAVIKDDLMPASIK